MQREEWDVIGKYVDAIIPTAPAMTKEIVESVVRALADPDYPAGNAAWKALADERAKREGGAR